LENKITKKAMMKTFLFLAVCCIVNTSLAQNSIQVKVSNIREATGNILIALFNNENDFLKKAVQTKTIKASGATMTIVFDNLAVGDYAISIIHDANGNGELDKNFMGVPREGFAFGNNSMGTFGPPPFEKAKVTVDDKKVVQEVSMRYM
jgi:uncharacterized protein (DUF2141 family)